MTSPVIRFQNVAKTFPRAGSHMLLRGYVRSLFHRKPEVPFYALRDVSFTVEAGESLAVIGSNGAGKSTLLGLVAGISTPDAGTVEISGRVAALLELGAGFHPDLTGAENVRLNAALLGMSRRRLNEIFEEVVEFSGVREFIGEPLRTYSSGMTVRLAFAVAVHCDPEVLLIDEVLVVGDQAFQAKCLDKIHGFREQGKTLLCVSHSPAMLLSLCDRAMWLDHGRVVAVGSAKEILEAYSSGAVATP